MLDTILLSQSVSFAQALLYVQTITVIVMVIAAKLHAHPLERAWLLLPFFVFAAEIASGISGL